MKLFAIVIAVLIVLIIIFCFIGRTENEAVSKEKISDNATVYDVTHAVDDKSYWVFESERKLAEQAQQQANLLKQIEEIRNSLNNNPQVESKADPHEQEIQSLRDRVVELVAGAKLNFPHSGRLFNFPA